MNQYGKVGESIPRKESLDKVSGRIKYLNDINSPDMLHAALKTSPHAHGKIICVETSSALSVPGVRAVLTGEDFPQHLGLYLGDKTPLARGKVRYFGEPVAAVVADTRSAALKAVELIEISYEPLEIINSLENALAPNAPALHEAMADYSHIDAIMPEPGSNIANRTKIRKGDIQIGFKESDVIIEENFSFPPGDHVAMEVRAAMAEILPNGQVILHSTTQAPFVVRSLMSAYFNIPPGKITVIAPPIGGGYGGKAGIQLEGLAYLLSKSVGGRKVKLVNTREQDLLTSPGHIGFEAKVRLGAAMDGSLKAAELIYMFDTGAYADYAVNISRAAAIACTGPYRIPNVWCDSLCIYTNHPFATAYRGFGHVEFAFAIERSMDILAEKLGIDALELRLRNAIVQGDTTPTQSIMDHNTGNLPECIRRVGSLIQWEKGMKTTLPNGTILAKGLGCLWKAPAMPTNSDAGAIITFNEDGSVNLHCGAVEIGQGIKTSLAQILAERLDVSVDLIHVVYEVNTSIAPHDWATAASRSLFMVGRAVIEAADDAINQLCSTASAVLKCPKEDIAVGGGRVFIKDEPEIGLDIKEVALGYMHPNGTAIGGQVIGRGKYIARRLTFLDPETGAGNPALEWTLGAQAVEIEFDPRYCTYRILRAASVMDVGRVINPQIAKGQVIGSIGMGLSFAAKEGFTFNARGQAQNGDLRSYKVLRYGEEPEYLIDFIETPQGDGPFGARGLGEQGVIGIPGALANALSRALGKPLNDLPLTPESIWSKKEGLDR